MRARHRQEWPRYRRLVADNSSSTRISRRFAELRERGELGIVAYITAGDPSLNATLQFVQALAEAGADVIELGLVCC